MDILLNPIGYGYDTQPQILTIPKEVDISLFDTKDYGAKLYEMTKPINAKLYEIRQLLPVVNTVRTGTTIGLSYSVISSNIRNTSDIRKTLDNISQV